jgi:hypothetical protein
VQAQTGRRFHIFLDKEDIGPAPNWEELLREALADVDVLVPVITPSFLNSDWCRREVMLFTDDEQRRGGVRAMFPLHYIQTERFEHPETDATVRTLRRHKWFDWRHLRRADGQSPERFARLVEIAQAIAASLAEQSARRKPHEDEAARQLLIAALDACETDPLRAVDLFGRLITEYRESPLAYRLIASNERARAMAAAGEVDAAIAQIDLFLKSIRDAFLPGQPSDDPAMAQMIDMHVTEAERLRAELTGSSSP